MNVLGNGLRPVIQYDLKMNNINEFPSIKDTAKQLSLNAECIRACCRYKQKTAGGFIFRYAEDVVLQPSLSVLCAS